MAGLAWLTPQGEIYKFVSASLGGRFSCDRVDQFGVTSHDWLPVMVETEHRIGWLEIECPTREAPYSAPENPCGDPECGRPAEFVFYPECDGPEDGRDYRCAIHASGGLTMPVWAEGNPKPWSWRVETL